MAGKKKKRVGDPNAIATNRKAFRDFAVLEKMEAGIALTGTEVKSIRNGGVTLTGSYARVEGTEIFLQGLHINPYDHGNQFNHEPDRSRRLLLHRGEIRHLIGKVNERGLTLVPLRMYFKRGRVKLELGLCRGKQHQDKREDMKRKTADREAARAMSVRQTR